MCYNRPLVRDEPLGAPAFVKLVYFNICYNIHIDIPRDFKNMGCCAINYLAGTGVHEIKLVLLYLYPATIFNMSFRLKKFDIPMACFSLALVHYNGCKSTYAYHNPPLCIESSRGVDGTATHVVSYEWHGFDDDVQNEILMFMSIQRCFVVTNFYGTI